MIPWSEIRTDDRVLLLSIPGAGAVADLAARLERGLLVGIGEEESVRAARRRHEALENAMFVLGSPGRIPWQECFFTLALDLEGGHTDASELARVLAPGGRAYLKDPDAAGLEAAGFACGPPDGDLMPARKPETR